MGEITHTLELKIGLRARVFASSAFKCVILLGLLLNLSIVGGVGGHTFA